MPETGSPLRRAARALAALGALALLVAGPLAAQSAGHEGHCADPAPESVEAPHETHAHPVATLSPAHGGCEDCAGPGCGMPSACTAGTAPALGAPAVVERDVAPATRTRPVVRAAAPHAHDPAPPTPPPNILPVR